MKYFNLKNLFLFIFASLLLMQKNYSQEQNIDFPITINHQIKFFKGDGEVGTFNLGNYIIIKDSVRVYINGFQLKEEKFKINYDERNVKFFNPPPKGSIIKIYFKVIPIQLKNSYYHRTGFTKFEPSEKNMVVISPIVEPPIEKEQDKSNFEKTPDPTLARGVGSRKTVVDLFNVEDIENIDGIDIWDGGDIIEEKEEKILIEEE